MEDISHLGSIQMVQEQLSKISMIIKIIELELLILVRTRRSCLDPPDVCLICFDAGGSKKETSMTERLQLEKMFI